MFLPDLAQTAEALAGDAMGELPDDVESLAHMLRDARRAQGAMADVARLIEAKLAEAMGTKNVKVDGLPLLERNWSPARTVWDHGPVAQQVAARSRDERHLDEATGVIEGEAECAARVILGTAGISYWRVGELKRLGIDPDEYREKEGGRWTVRFV